MSRWWEDLRMAWRVWRVLRQYPGRLVKVSFDGRIPVAYKPGIQRVD